MSDDHPMARLEPEGFAADFSGLFPTAGLSRPEPAGRAVRADGYRQGVPAKLPGTLRGVHYTLPDGSYAIHYQEGQWAGTSEYTLLHEGYEIVYETLWDRCHNEAPEQKVCSEADRFAAAALMPPETFAAYARASGLDVVELHRVFRCSYSAAALRLGEVLCAQPLAVVLYEREDDGDPATWERPTKLGDLRATVVEAHRRLPAPALPPAHRLAERQSPVRKTPVLRFPGGAGGPQRQDGVRRGGRHCRGRKARLLEGTPRQGDRGRPALGTSPGAGPAAWGSPVAGQ